MSIAAAYYWSRLILPFRKEQIPFSGWGDGTAGSAATFQVPVLVFWLVTMSALCFICIKPHLRLGNGLTRLGRWLTNVTLVPAALVLVLYAMHGPPVRFLAVYAFLALTGLWLYVDLAAPNTKGAKSR